jgi:ABC-type lipoprotein export system ATPase subunit
MHCGFIFQQIAMMSTLTMRVVVILTRMVKRLSWIKWY